MSGHAEVMTFASPARFAFIGTSLLPETRHAYSLFAMAVRLPPHFPALGRIACPGWTRRADVQGRVEPPRRGRKDRYLAARWHAGDGAHPANQGVSRSA